MKKTAAKILFGISAALCVGFVVKICVDYNTYTHTINSAPFIVCIAVNALYFIAPAAVLSAIALFLMRKTKALTVCAASFGVLAAFFLFYFTITYGRSELMSGNIGRIGEMLLGSLVLAIPLVFSGIIFLIFALVSRNLQKKAA